MPGVDAAHDAVLKKVRRLGGDVGADIEQHARPFQRGHQGGDAWTARHVLEKAASRRPPATMAPVFPALTMASTFVRPEVASNG